MNKFFLDAAYAIALSAVTDQYHRKAEFLARQIETEAIPLITTTRVIRYWLFGIDGGRGEGSAGVGYLLLVIC